MSFFVAISVITRRVITINRSRKMSLFSRASTRQIDFGLAILRVVVGAIFVAHGAQKLFVFGSQESFRRARRVLRWSRAHQRTPDSPCITRNSFDDGRCDPSGPPQERILQSWWSGVPAFARRLDGAARTYGSWKILDRFVDWPPHFRTGDRAGRDRGSKGSLTQYRTVGVR